MTSEMLMLVLSLGLMLAALLLAVWLLLRHAASESREYRRSLLEISILHKSTSNAEFEQTYRQIQPAGGENPDAEAPFYYTGDSAYAEQVRQTQGTLNDDELTSILGGN